MPASEHRKILDPIMHGNIPHGRDRRTSGMMSGGDPHLLLRDFVAWVRIRRQIDENAWVDEKTLEVVTQGIERFLAGNNPWPKSRGNKSKPDVMWKCYWLVNFAEKDNPHLPQHTLDGGAFSIVGERLHISEKTVESHVRKARKLMDTEDGRAEFLRWVSKEKNATCVSYIPAGNPLAVAEQNRRESAGIRNRKRRAKIDETDLSGEIGPK